MGRGNIMNNYNIDTRLLSEYMGYACHLKSLMTLDAEERAAFTDPIDIMIGETIYSEEKKTASKEYDDFCMAHKDFIDALCNFYGAYKDEHGRYMERVRYIGHDSEGAWLVEEERPFDLFARIFKDNPILR